MKQLMKKVWKPVAGLAGLAALVIWSLGVLEAREKPGHIAHLPGIPVPAGAAPVTVRLAESVSRVEVVGTVAPEQRVVLSSQLSAAIREVRVSAGNAVTNGQLLVTLDDRELQEQVNMAEAQYRQAEAENRRATQLFEKAATTEQSRMAAESGYQAAKARLAQARVMLGYARIVSPIDGVVADRRIEQGDLASPGQPLLEVYDPARMRLEVAVPLRFVSRFAPGQEVEIRLEGVNRVVQGKVQEIVSEADPMTRTQRIKVGLGDSALRPLPGVYGSLWVEGGTSQTLWAPSSAVYRVGQQEFVQVVTDGRAIQRSVKTGVMRGDQVEILSGLNDGDAVLAVPVIKEG